MKKKIVINAVIIIATVTILIKNIPVIGFLIIAMSDDRMSKKNIIKYVTENQEKIEAVVDEFINENPGFDGDITEKINIPPCKAIKQIYLHQKRAFYPVNDERVEFACGGYGMGSETGYAGFYYSLSETKIETNDETNTADMSPLGYYTTGTGSGYNNFSPEGEGWLWNEINGDNTVYIENITGNFYYYLEEY